MDWQTVTAVGALLVAMWSVLSRTFDKSLSLREHEEYRRSQEREMEILRQQMIRDDSRLESRIGVIEQARPTAGELEAKISQNKSA